VGRKVDLDHLVDVHGVARLAKLTRARINQLIISDTMFPAPVKQFGIMKIWLVSDVEHWLKVRVINPPGRKPKNKPKGVPVAEGAVAGPRKG
jgi:predicted DNA-binding transcriptional regulator AlpA